MTRIESKSCYQIKHMENMINSNINTKEKQERDEIRVMVYPSIFNVDDGKQESVESIIKGIKNQSKRKSVGKKQLPVAYFSVVQFNGNKTSNNVTKHSGLIVIDIDVKDNPNLDFENLYSNLLWNKYTYACFRSPNSGIKLVVNTDISNAAHHCAYYEAIKNYLLERYRDLDEIDTSGSNISRGCYLPFDANAYFIPYSEKFSASLEYIEEYTRTHPLKPKSNFSSKPLLHVEYLSYDDHFENIKNVLLNWTSMGQDDKDENINGDVSKETSVGYSIDEGTLVGQESNQGTSMGIYDSIFNEYRFHNISNSVMSTNVPLFELLVLRNNTPSEIEHKTRLDEIYFKNNPNKPISTDDLEGLDGLEVCEMNINKETVINKGHRGKTLSLMCMKLIYNNPFCHPRLILKELRKTNHFYCEDPEPKTNPAPDETELNTIVSSCYQRFIDGELDFGIVLRKKKTKDEVSKRKVFWSRYCEKIDPWEKQKISIKVHSKAIRDKNIRLYEEAINALQDGEIITVKRIAKYMGLSTKQVGRYRNDKRYQELMHGFQNVMNEYNTSIKNKINKN